MASIEGIITSDAAYSLDEFERRTGLKRTALRMARQAGLQVRRAHGRGYVLGADWIDYLGRQRGDESTAIDS